MTIQINFVFNRGDFTLEVDLDIPSEGITAILGPSGCGKTTLLRTIAGLEKPKDAKIEINGQVWQNKDTFRPTHQRSLGYVFQESSLFDHLDVNNNIQYGYKRVKAHSDNKIQLEELVTLLGLNHLLDRYPHQLSGGEKQRAAIARALAVNPSLLLMDEPLASLDRVMKKEILPYLERLNSSLNIPILYVSHSTDEVARLADKVLLMDLGKVIAFGPVNTILTRLDLPLSKTSEAEAIIEAEVVRYTEDTEHSTLQFSAGEFQVPSHPLDAGTKVRLRIAAQDVSVTLDRQQHTSILNIFKTRIIALEPLDNGHCLLTLTLGKETLLARISKYSSQKLGLKPDMQVFAQVKGVAILA